MENQPRVRRMRGVESDGGVINFLLSFGGFDLLYIFRVEDRYLFDAQDVLRGLIQLNPVEVAVTRVWINADYDPFIPAFIYSEFGIKVNFYAIPDAD